MVPSLHICSVTWSSADELRPAPRCLAGRPDLGLTAAVRLQTGLGQGQGQRGVSSRIAELEERLRVEVADRVARLVVAGVVRRTSGASVHGRLLGSLDALSAAEESARWNADRDEGPVIGPTIEWSRLGREALVSEVLREDLLDGGGSRWPGGRAVGAVTVVDEPDIVGRAHHVEVEVRIDLRQLRLG